MKETILTILNYLSSAVSVAGFVVVAKVILKKLANFTDIKERLKALIRKVADQQEESEKLRKQIASLQMQLKGHKKNGKESVQKN